MVDLNLLNMILGVVATIIVGFWGIKYTYRNTTKTNLFFFENSCISLFRKVVKDLDELEIKYKGQPVDKNLIIYKGTFFNSGNTDIDKSIIHKPLQIILPKDYEWKKVGIIDKSEEVNVETVINSNELTFIWDILKENEFYTFDSVIEYKPKISNDNKSSSEVESITRHLSKNIKFSQRITNLKSVTKEKLPSKPIRPWQFIFGSLFLLMIVFFFTKGFIGQIFYPDNKTLYEVKIDSTFKYVSFEFKTKNEIQLTDSLGREIATLVIDKLINIKFTGKNKTCKKNINYRSLIANGFVAIFFLLVFVSMAYSYFKDRRLYRRLKMIADKYDHPNFSELL
jgi:hypothetical protein